MHATNKDTHDKNDTCCDLATLQRGDQPFVVAFARRDKADEWTSEIVQVTRDSAIALDLNMIVVDVSTVDVDLKTALNVGDAQAANLVHTPCVILFVRVTAIGGEQRNASGMAWHPMRVPDSIVQGGDVILRRWIMRTLVAHLVQQGKDLAWARNSISA